SVEGYVAHSALIVGGSQIGGPGEVTLELLDHNLGDAAHLRFVSEGERRSVVKDEAKRLAGKLLGPRLGRVGYFGRMLDALFLASLVLRPTTPRLTTVAASLKADRNGLHDRPTCYGRVVQVGDWLVLHYAFFYVMNDWRSGYRGVNDHEADWEQAWIFCDPADQAPVWVVASSHDNAGADLRRHWDDTELRRLDDRPILYAGAGSHALYFRPGDYVTRIDVPALRPLLRVRRWSQRALSIREEETDRGLGPALGAPFVDAAPGNGRTIESWTLEHLDEQRSWFGGYRGLWGLDTTDPLNSERAPAGPKFQRDGEIRQSWADPVGFAGLHSTSPPSLADLQISLDNIEAGLDHIDDELRQVSRLMSLASRASVGEEIAHQSDQLSSLLKQRTELQDLRRRLRRGDVTGRGIRDHLEDPAVPLAPPKETGWILAIWATVSIPLVMLSIAAPLLLSNLRVLGPLLALVAAFSVLEQLVRRRFNAALRLSVLYVAVAALFGFVSVVTVSLYAFGATLAVAAVLLLIGNLGELSAVRRRGEPTAEPVDLG
ncbi:MAG: hypothetical protein OEV40_22430, partial [Acidimicrobiia bacterium]|nr:hypothetical protein [Acidimicrobiia bacterium]